MMVVFARRLKGATDLNIVRCDLATVV